MIKIFRQVFSTYFLLLHGGQMETSTITEIDEAIKLYKQNKKGDIELGIRYHLPRRKWHAEDEVLYENVPQCLKVLSTKYKIGIIANQSLGTQNRLEQYGL